MAIRRQRHRLTLNADWLMSYLFVARRIAFTILHSTMDPTPEKNISIMDLFPLGQINKFKEKL